MSLSLPSGASLQETAGGATLLKLATPLLQASLSLQGGQLLEFARPGGRPWLYLSPQALFAPGKAIRGGIPVCWPWFGPHPADPAQPQHGVARAAPWTLDEVRREGDVFHVKLSGPAWQGLAVAIEYTLGEDIQATLLSRNHGAAAHTVSAALHSYLAIGDVAALRIHGLSGLRCHDKVRNAQTTLPTAPLALDGEFDGIIYGAPCVTLEDAAWQRRLEISSQGSASTVLWNPWQDKAARLADLPDDGWRQFVCVETANAGEDARELAPGATHSLVTRIRELAV